MYVMVGGSCHHPSSTMTTPCLSPFRLTFILQSCITTTTRSTHQQWHGHHRLLPQTRSQYCHSNGGGCSAVDKSDAVLAGQGPYMPISMPIPILMPMIMLMLMLMLMICNTQMTAADASPTFIISASSRLQIMCLYMGTCIRYGTCSRYMLMVLLYRRICNAGWGSPSPLADV
jgi:hypothetical protein